MFATPLPTPEQLATPLPTPGQLESELDGCLGPAPDHHGQSIECHHLAAVASCQTAARYWWKDASEWPPLSLGVGQRPLLRKRREVGMRV